MYIVLKIIHYIAEISANDEPTTLKGRTDGQQ